MTPIRERLVALAESYAGVSVSTDRQRYLDLVAPGDTRTEYFAHPKTSGCALVVRGLWREAGLQNERLLRPYVVGQAIADVVGIARAAGAWVTAAELATTGRRPLPGDVVMVGAPAHEHVYTVVGVGSRDAYASVDGGQLDAKGQQAIARRQRFWTPDRGTLLDAALAGLHRPVVGLVDVDLLPWPALDLPGA